MTPAYSEDAELSPDGRSLTVRLPLTLRKRGGRKIIVSPAGEQPWTPARPRIDNTMIRALARAFRWKHLLESGRFATVSELAAAEKLDLPLHVVTGGEGPASHAYQARLILVRPDQFVAWAADEMPDDATGILKTASGRP